MAEKALTDEKPEVRSSAAGALGAMHSKASIAKLREAADDQDPFGGSRCRTRTDCTQ